VRIEVETVDGIGVIGPADAVFVHFEVAANEIAHEQSSFFRNEILELKPLLLHPISSHKSFLFFPSC